MRTEMLAMHEKKNQKQAKDVLIFLNCLDDLVTEIYK